MLRLAREKAMVNGRAWKCSAVSSHAMHHSRRRSGGEKTTNTKLVRAFATATHQRTSDPLKDRVTDQLQTMKDSGTFKEERVITSKQ